MGVAVCFRQALRNNLLSHLKDTTVAQNPIVIDNSVSQTGSVNLEHVYEPS